MQVGLDILIYGLWMTALYLSPFSVVLSAFGNGNLAYGCNKRYSTDCDTVLRARTTTFVCLVWFSLLLSWELVDGRCLLFRLWRRGTINENSLKDVFAKLPSRCVVLAEDINAVRSKQSGDIESKDSQPGFPSQALGSWDPL